MEQMELTLPPHVFGGATYDEARDGKRLGLQFTRVAEVMADGQWRSLDEIAQLVGAPQASVSARLRDLRKPAFGGRQVERIYIERGLFKYRLVPRPNGEAGYEH